MLITLSLIACFTLGWMLRGIVTGEKFYEHRKIEGYKDGLEVGRQEVYKWKHQNKRSPVSEAS